MAIALLLVRIVATVLWLPVMSILVVLAVMTNVLIWLTHNLYPVLWLLSAYGDGDFHAVWRKR